MTAAQQILHEHLLAGGRFALYPEKTRTYFQELQETHDLGVIFELLADEQVAQGRVVYSVDLPLAVVHLRVLQALNDGHCLLSIALFFENLSVL